MSNQRLFIGLELSLEDKFAIGNWRDKHFGQEAFGPYGKPVPIDNFHITLTFLGNVAAKHIETLDLALQDTHLTLEDTHLNTGQITTELTSLGVFIKPQILYLGVDLTDSLQQLAKQCRRLNAKLGLPQQHETFRPHITLFRKHKSATPLDIPPLTQKLTFSHFHLFESLSNATYGKSPSYVKRMSYPLTDKLR